jgi:PAS domain S-box-containing protein
VANVELILGRPDGSRVTVLVNPISLHDERGQVCGAADCMIDITDRKGTEEALKTKEAQLAHIARSVRVVLYEAEPVEPFAARWVSENIELLSGFPARQFLDDPMFWAARLHPQDHDRVVRDFARFSNDRTLISEYRWRCADGMFRWFQDQAVIIHTRSGQPRAMLGIWQDITHQKETQQQLQRSFVQLRALSQRLEAIREEERSRVAREIHDELGGRLTCLKSDLLYLNGLAPEQEPTNRPGALRKKCQSMVQLIDQTIEVVQRIARELRPRMLDELGLMAAIEWQTQEFEKRTGIRCQYISTGQEFAIDRERATALFRICQEALTNVARHARATTVMVRLAKTGDHVLLMVEDNGDGIAAEKIMDMHALGLAGMRERAALLGGECRITGNPGKGTMVMVRIPFEQNLRGDRDAEHEECEPQALQQADDPLGIAHSDDNL